MGIAFCLLASKYLDLKYNISRNQRDVVCLILTYIYSLAMLESTNE